MTANSTIAYYVSGKLHRILEHNVKYLARTRLIGDITCWLSEL